jgi:hypothetical protein
MTFTNLANGLTRFGRPVDLLVARAVCNPYLLESINQTRESLYAAA